MAKYTRRKSDDDLLEEYGHLAEDDLYNALEEIDGMDEDEADLNSWETGFLDNTLRQGGNFTIKQRLVIYRLIDEKLGGW